MLLTDKSLINWDMDCFVSEPEISRGLVHIYNK